MKTMQILEALEHVDDKYLIEAKADNSALLARKDRRLRVVILAAAIIAVLASTVFAAYHVGLINGWWQKPSNDPLAVVQSAVEGEINWDYTFSSKFEYAEIDEAETSRWKTLMKASELARSYGWSDDYIENHFLAVQAVYEVRYDHTKTWQPDGQLRELFFLKRDPKTMLWEVYDNLSPERVEDDMSMYWTDYVDTDPFKLIQTALRGLKNKTGTLSLEVETIREDSAEAAAWIKFFRLSRYVQNNGYSEDYLNEHVKCIVVVYDVDYDETQIQDRRDGRIEQRFYLLQDVESGAWQIVDVDDGIDYDPQYRKQDYEIQGACAILG